MSTTAALPTPAGVSGKEPDPQLHRIETIPGIGRALIVCTPIPLGTRILCEKPLFTTTSTSYKVMNADITKKLRALPVESQRQFLSLHNNFTGTLYPFTGTFITNALPCGPDSDTAGVYATICLINHSCSPNAHTNWNNALQKETLHATRPIVPGEQITICYTQTWPSYDRRAYLKHQFGFDCACTLCQLPAVLLKRSDARRSEIVSLDKLIGDANLLMSNPQEALAACHKLLIVVNEELWDGGSTPLLARLYYDAVQITITHGDQARASVFAQRAYEARVVCDGEDSPETERMKGFARDPSSHKNFGSSKKWKSKKAQVPKDLGDEEFEAWLWRVEKR
ncbi:hypothetical protein BDV95DRAFT_496735 [Massariosphaeria phaeospora]|uniref:SET domain-containing protein n=1 Tax=Massariosphaeria phaeospora TaxID=100035 RepID=A0A7C8I3W6_9PLEO|nr:hypothetical protein BDV95DRAFT_496735 [Massariosphaeria phaeospora]